VANAASTLGSARPRGFPAQSVIGAEVATIRLARLVAAFLAGGDMPDSAPGH
jgi:hypothetical protein